MYKYKLGMSTSRSFGLDIETELKLFRAAGFECFHTGWREDLKKCRKVADEIGIEFEAVHATFGKMGFMWQEGDEVEEFIEAFIGCVRSCAEVNVPILVAHVYGGKVEDIEPSEIGLKRLRRAVDEAKRLGVKIAFENTYKPEHLAAVMEEFKDYDNVGFCIDTGHQCCMTPDVDMMELYGDRLIYTHLNDNLGISDYNGKFNIQDDLHLLPMDGIADWDKIARQMNKFDYKGTLTLELSVENCDNRYDNEKYQRVDIRQYIAEAYARACRFAALRERNKI